MKASTYRYEGQWERFITVYCNRSCLCVCVFVTGGRTSGRAVSEPYYSQRAQCLLLSERFFHSSSWRIALCLAYQCARSGPLMTKCSVVHVIRLNVKSVRRIPARIKLPDLFHFPEFFPWAAEIPYFSPAASSYLSASRIFSTNYAVSVYATWHREWLLTTVVIVMQRNFVSAVNSATVLLCSAAHPAHNRTKYSKLCSCQSRRRR